MSRFRLVDGLLGHLQTQKLQPAVDVPDAVVVVVLTLARIVRFLLVVVLLLRHWNLLLATTRNSTHRGQVDRGKKLRLLLLLLTLLQLLQKLLLVLVRGNVVQRMSMVHKVGSMRWNVRRLLLGWRRNLLLLRLMTTEGNMLRGRSMVLCHRVAAAGKIRGKVRIGGTFVVAIVVAGSAGGGTVISVRGNGLQVRSGRVSGTRRRVLLVGLHRRGEILQGALAVGS